MRKHRAGTLAMIAVSALALAACGRAEGGAGAAEGPGEAIEEGAASGTIEVWAMGHEGEILDYFSAAFEDANPDADVKVTAVPWEAAYSKISNAVAAGNTPDVALVGTTWMGEFAKAGGIAPMPEGLVDGDDFFEGAWNSTLVGGTAYGVPWYVETRVLYYRKDLAEKAGWSEAPQTWDDLKQFTVDLQEKAGVEHGIQLPAGGGGSWTTMMSFGWSNGGSLVNEDGTEYTLDTPQTAEAMADAGSPTPTRSRSRSPSWPVPPAGSADSEFSTTTWSAEKSPCITPWCTRHRDSRSRTDLATARASSASPGIAAATPRNDTIRNWRRSPRGCRTGSGC
jgi:multiple sugar transport system substrate-binding protein